MSRARIAMVTVIGVIAVGCGGARPPAPTGEPPEYEPPRQFDLPGSEPAAAPKNPEGEPAGTTPGP
jgi:hypothetical protein